MTSGAELPRVLVLLASFNGERFVEDQLATILHQQDVHVRVHVRDDGSTDGTMRLLEAARANEHRLTVEADGGRTTKSAAMNFITMLMEADFDDAEYIALADQDDLWLSGKLARAVLQLRQGQAAGYSADLMAFDDQGRRAPWLVVKHGPQRRYDYLFQGASAGCTYVLTRAGAARLRSWLRGVTFPVDIGVSHDWIIYAFFRASGLGWVCDDVATILYRQHANNVYGSRRGFGDLLARIKLLRDRWYRRHIAWLASQLELGEAERDVARRVTRLSLLDRCWLVGRAGQARRRHADVLKLRLALIARFF